MSLAVYIGTEKFHDELKGEAQAQPVNAVTLSDIANGQQSHTSEGHPSLLLSDFTEEALVALEGWLKKDAERTCILAWPHPSAWLAASLQQESRPKEALWQWSYQADLILKLYKRKRRQVTLEGYLPGVTPESQVPLVAELTLASTTPIDRLMAHQLTQEDSLLQQTYNYLKASSAHVAAWQLPAVDAVEQSLHYLKQENQQLEALKANADTVQKELSSSQQSSIQLRKQLKELQAGQKQIKERLSEKNAQLLETEKTKDALRAQLNKEQETHAKLQDHAHNIEKENAALLEQLMKVQEALEENILANQAHQVDFAEKEIKLNWLRKKTKNQEAKLEEHKTALSQLKEDHKKALDEKQKHVQALGQAQTKLQEQYEEAEKQATVSRQQLEQESIEKSLIVTQLHETQEQLAKNVENVEHYKGQADNRQKTINVLKQEQQLTCHQYESVTQWLRVSGHRNAAAAYRYSRPFKRALPQQVATIKQSSFFDAQWYCEQYPDVTTSGIEPAEHYLKFGAIEGRNPSEKFDTLYYLCEYPDVAVSGQNPLLHYLRYGQHEERFPARPRQQLPAPVGEQDAHLTAR
ncbi:MAG: hypothetical protein KA748_10350 [Halomonas sp.]|nr:hypothetical protein [Halomonas sp.]MBP5980596.1 hypothetical protein [Halomonas sp.]